MRRLSGTGLSCRIPPAWWGQGKTAHLLTGALPYSGSWRGVLAESEEQACLVASLHGVCERLGGVTRRWRTDRMSTVCHPESGEVTALFAEVAKYYSVAVDVCPSRRGWRKGSVEKGNHSAAQRWWRTLPDDCSPEQAQARLDGFCVRNGAARRRVRDGQRVSAAELAAAEPLMTLAEVRQCCSLETVSLLMVTLRDRLVPVRDPAACRGDVLRWCGDAGGGRDEPGDQRDGLPAVRAGGCGGQLAAGRCRGGRTNVAGGRTIVVGR